MPHRQHYRPRSSRPFRTLAFAALAVAIVGAAIYFVRPKELNVVELGPATGSDMTAMHGDQPVAGADAPADLSMRVDMNGFSPPELRIAAGRSVRLKLVNPDNSLHTDGGGVHGFTVPSLGINIKVPPLTAMVLTLPATAAAGDHPFYCDTCCGGKENPAMNGVIRVGA